MPVSKLKNLALLILLLANLALLSLLIPNKVAQRQEDANLRQSLSDLYAAQQVALDPQVVPDTVTLYALELAENSQANLQAAKALLGESVLIQDDSTRYLSLYESTGGSCSISQNGAFLAQIDHSPEVKDLSRDTKQVLEAIGFQWHTVSAPTRLRAGVFALTAEQTVLGVPVFSDGLTLTYANNQLSKLEGTFFTGFGTLTRTSEQACITAADALTAFLSARFDLGWVGSTVTAMEQGYLQADTSTVSSVHLTPTWKLETDSGSFYVNGLTGNVSSAD